MKKIKLNNWQIILIIWGVCFIITHFVIIIGNIPTGSMCPTIKDGSMVIGDRITKTYERGDIVMFWSDEEHKLLIKRIIGLPGETVSIKDNKIYINKDEFNEPYVEKWEDFDDYEFEIPVDCYLFLGDNRDNSRDARYWQNPYINQSKIKAKYLFTLF